MSLTTDFRLMTIVNSNSVDSQDKRKECHLPKLILIKVTDSMEGGDVDHSMFGLVLPKTDARQQWP